MSLAVFSSAIATPRYDGFGYSPTRDVLVLRFGRGQFEQRIQRDGGPFRSYDLSLRVDSAGRALVDSFFAARGFTAESFLWRDPMDSYRTGVSLGASVAAQTVFTLPTTGDARGDYPIDAAGTVLYDDGAPVAKTVQTDDRTLTASVAPTAASAMTADLVFYKRVRLDGTYAWAVVEGGAAYDVGLRFVEVPA